jgi:4-hydroxy-2-oxoheptanedioate aldolase
MTITPIAVAVPLAGRLHTGDNLVGLILKMSAPAMVELGGFLGFDLAIVDTEHGIAGGTELDHHVRAADAAGIPVIVRVSMLNRPEIQRALDGGAVGIIVPQVESAQQAREAVGYAHYPPFGGRGLATSTRAGHHGTVPTLDYLRDARENTVVVVQIESRAGVENAAEILAVPGVSAIWIGLSDLLLDLGHFGDMAHPDVVAAVSTVVQTAAEAGIPLLVIADTEKDAAVWIGKGAQVLLINLLTVVARGLRTLKNSHQAAQIERNNA